METPLDPGSEQDAPKTLEGYIKDHERQVGEFLDKVDASKNVIDLRNAWMDTPLLSNIAGYVSEAGFQQTGERILSNLRRLGLDPDSDDERMRFIKQEIERAPDAARERAVLAGYKSARGEGPLTIEMGLHSSVSTALYRVISGCSPEVSDGLQLATQETLVGKPLSGFRDAAFRYTQGMQQEIPHRFGRKGSRVNVDPGSKFWGFSVYTDTWPGNGRENIYMYMPSGLILAREVRRVTPDRYGTKTQEYINSNDPAAPRSIEVQGLHLGERDMDTINVDTESGLVSQFLAQIPR